MIHVLLVDDDLVILEIVKVFLERSDNVKVDTCFSAKEAIGTLKEKYYDVIVSDYEMPEMNGISFLKLIRSMDQYIPFILFTGRGREDVVIDAINNGADYYLRKEGDVKVQFAELSHQIRQAVARNRAEKRIKHLNSVLQAIRNVNQLISREKDPEKLLQGACNSLVETHGYYSVWSLLLDESKRLITAAEAGLGESFRPIIEGFDVGKMPDCMQKALNLPGVLIIEDPTTTCTNCAISLTCHLRGSISARLEYDEKIYGFINLTLPKQLINDVEEQELAEEIANNISLALHNINVKSERKQAREQLLAQHELATRLSGTTSLDEALKHCIVTAIEVAGMDCGGIYLCDEDSGDLQLRCATGLSNDFIEEVSHLKSDSPTAQRIMSGHALYIQHHKMELPHLHGADKREGLKAAAIIPILYYDDVIGSLHISTHTLDEVPLFSRNALETMAAQVGNSIIRLQMTEILKEREEMYRTFFETTGTIMMLVEEDTTISLVNSEMEKLSGYTKSEIEGKMSWAKIVAKDDLERLKEYHIQRRIDPDSAPRNYEFKFIDKYGKITDVFVTIAMIPGTKKSLASLVDISGRKQMEEVLRRSEETYRTIFENTVSGMLIIEEDTTLSLVNSEMAKLLGYSKNEIEGKRSWTEFVAEDDLEKMLEYHHLRRIDPLAAPREYEFTLIDQFGNLRKCMLTASIIPGTKKSVVSVMDITEMRQYRDALKQSNKKLNILNKITRHDILNHIMGLSGYITLLDELLPKDPTMKRCLHNITKLTENIQRQIIFMQEYQDLGLNQPVWQHVDTVMRQAAKEVPLENINLKVKTGSLEILADPMLKRVFFNLLDNAVRHGEGVTDIWISFYEQDGMGSIVIEDNGQGILGELKERIFEEDFGKNTGYGLFLAKDILSITKMAIRETGREGKGSRMEIEIPQEYYKLS